MIKIIYYNKNKNYSYFMKIKDQILEVLKNSEGHMSAEQMYLYCVNNDIKVSMASTYRVLGKLAEDGQIRKISVSGQPDIFDKTLSDHEHLVCSCCGKVKDIKIKGFKESIKKSIKDDFDSYDLCIKYVCPECRKKINIKKKEK